MAAAAACVAGALVVLAGHRSADPLVEEAVRKHARDLPLEVNAASVAPEAITALLQGKTSWSLPERSVCDTCPVIREKKSGGGPVKRWLENMPFNPEEGLDKMRCINEMGFLCQGPVTLAGCAGKTGVPRCIQARTPCRGCFGPIRKGAQPSVEMLGALSSVGMDPKSLVDRRATLNRYIGAHGTLKVLPSRPTK